MRVSRSRPIVFGFIFAVGITLSLPYLAFGAGPPFGGSARFRAPKIHRERFVSHPFHRLDFWVWARSARSQSSLFNSFCLQQPPDRENLPQTEFTFRHAGWTVGTEWRSYSQDTGSTQSKRLSVDTAGSFTKTHPHTPPPCVSHLHTRPGPFVSQETT